MLAYLKARLSEKSTAAGLASLAVALAVIFLPQYADAIVAVASACGVTAAVVPTSKP